MGLHSAHRQESSEPAFEAVGNADDWLQLAEADNAAAFCRAWLTLQCEQMDNLRCALLLMESEAKTYVPAAVWPNQQTDVNYLGKIAQRCLSERKGCTEYPQDASGRLLVAYPIELAGVVVAAVILDLQARSESQLQRVMQSLHWGSGRLEVMLQRRHLAQRDKALERAALALELSVGVAEQSHLDEAAMRLVNELAKRLGCERVAVGLEQGGRLRLQALSSAAWFEKKAEFSLAIENAMEEAVDQGCSIAWPALPGTNDVIAVAHRSLAGKAAVYTAPLLLRGRAIGAITCLADAPRDADFMAALEAVAALVAPSLDSRLELHRWFAGRLSDRVRSLWQGLFDPRRPSFRVGLVAVIAVVLFFSLVHGDYRVAGRAVVEGEVQRAVVAPFDGFIATANVRAGQRVRAGDVIATLDDRDLALERGKWLAEHEQADRKYRDALAKHERANAHIIESQMAEAAAQLALADDKLSKSHLLAPFDGIVVSGDLSQMLGSPVEKGKLLFEVAPLDAYRVIVKVPETEIRDLRANQSGQIVLAGLSDQRYAFKVKNIGIASAEEGENVFRIEARLENAPAGIRPGMEGVGKIVVGERRLIWIWTHSFFDWLSLKLWRWLP